MKALLLRIAELLSGIWRLVPEKLRRSVIKGLLVLESRGSDKRAALKRLFNVADDLELVTNERALALGDMVHPKHRLTRYHDFFVERIHEGDAVLDVGCGYGAVARSVARAHPKSRVVGVDYDKGRLAQARAAAESPPNLSFVEADATRSVPEGPWNVVILSNVLEHIHDRPGFLRRLVAVTGAERFLIRVPLFERDWKMSMRREVGANYFSDSDHKIEHTRAEFRAETGEAGLEIDELVTLWGEIWSALSTPNKLRA